jgi:hypothetical protein
MRPTSTAEDRARDEANGFDIKAEMVATRRIVRGCLPIVAAELRVELEQSLQLLCDVAFNKAGG